ncbi:MAG: hypothetical protein COA54_01540 [Thiotrichaceae bacterium]|nr:MAG: hypothetical protein COA54_01540 [Thiotrichaceae bacterium]
MRNRKFKRESSSNKCGNSKNESILNLITDAHDNYDRNHLEQANFLYQQVLRSEPDNIQALNGLGLIAMQIGMLTLAVEFLTSACEIEPRNMTVNNNLALVYTRMSRYDDAIVQYFDMLELDQNNSVIYGELARLNLRQSQFDLALKYYRHAFYLAPEDPRNLHGIAQLDAKSITKDELDLVETVLDRNNLPLVNRCSLYFSLGDIYDGYALYDEAFANYSVANMCKAKRFNLAEYTKHVSSIIDTFSLDLFDKFSSTELNPSSQPVFIVGLPHSGEALVEQILASHTDVYTAGSSVLIDDFANKLLVSNENDKHTMLSINYITTDSLNDLAQFYLSNLNNLAMKNDHKIPQVITNKMQLNFTNLGLIALLFPNARIIDCRRNPIDVCLSCFFQNLSDEHDYSLDLKETALYYQQYERLMAHWQKVLPVNIHTINYETLINDTETICREVIAYAGLEWQEQCLDFYNTKRHVNMENPVQLKYGVYKSSINNWQHYEKHLHLLKKTLSMTDCAVQDDDLTAISPHDFKKDYKASKYIRQIVE